jgi:hypothetical protein
MNDLGVIVLSCDKYSDLWNPYFELFFRAWPDCPFKLYLAANRRRFPHDTVVTLQSGEDTDWSSSIRRSVEQIPEKCVLFLYDDAFLTRRVPTDRVAAHFDWFLRHGANYLRMRPLPRPDAKVEKDVGLIRPGSPYRTSLFGSIWRKQLIVDLLEDGESAWAFELQGTTRADAHGGFYATYSHVFSYLHGVEKGKWFPWSVRSLRKRGIRPDLDARPTMSLSESARYLSRLPNGYVLRLIPPSLWPRAFELKRAFQTGFRG